MNPIQTTTIFRFLGAIGLLVAGVGQVYAQNENSDKVPAAAAEQAKTTRFLLHPAEMPYAAMKYRLLPKYIEQTPGNAAPQYFAQSWSWATTKLIKRSRKRFPIGANCRWANCALITRPTHFSIIVRVTIST